MKFTVCILVCFALLAFAGERTATGGHNEPAGQRGSYTIEESFAVGQANSYGLTIQDAVSNSIWICDYTALQNNEFDMTTGVATGTTFAVTSGVDPDDMGYCEYSGSENQFFYGDWSGSWIAVYDESTTGAGAYHNKNIDGPAAWSRICGVAAGHDNMYASDFFTDEIGWAPYTGTESTISWSTAAFNTVSGMAVWGDFLFICTQNPGEDNIFILELNPDGSPNMTPVWSCEFTEDPDGPNGGIDFDGAYLWVYPQNGNLFKLDIDFDTALTRSSWGSIKTSF